MEGPIDKHLRANGNFLRFPSLSAMYAKALGMSMVHDWSQPGKDVEKRIQDYRQKFVRLMAPHFKAPALSASESGPLVNCDEAIEGIPECYRRRILKSRAPLRIGLNISRNHSASDIVSIRGGACMAFIDLCKMRGQKVEIELVYGLGLQISKDYWYTPTHLRCSIPSPDLRTLTQIICSDSAIHEVGINIVAGLMKAPTYGSYRFHEFPLSWGKEFDFVLDRIETKDPRVEEDRVLRQLKAFGLMK